MTEKLGRFAYRRRWLVLAAAVAFLAVAVAWGTGVFGRLTSGGFEDPGSESARAAAVAAADLGRDDADVVVLYRSADRTVDDPAYRQAVTGTLEALPSDAVARTVSWFGTGAPGLVSADRHATYAVLTLRGDEQQRTDALERIEDRLAAPGLQTEVGGATTVGRDIGEQVSKDIARAETLSMPVLLVLLVLVFGTVVAASLPLVIGVVAILGAFTALHVLSLVTDVSVFSVNVVTILGLGLAIDYGLFVVGRYREELGRGLDTEAAIVATMATAGRTVAVSGLTVAASLAGLLIFPQVFLRSMGAGGIAAVLVAVAAALTVLPALLAVLGPRVEALPVRRRRARLHADTGAFARLARSVMRRPVLYLAGVLAIVAVLGLPIGGAHFAGTDVRVLPAGAEARVVSEQIAAGFPVATTAPIEALVQGASGGQVRALTAGIRSVPGVTSAAVTASRSGSALVTVDYRGPSNGGQAYTAVRDIRALPLPAGVTMLVGGAPADDVDQLASLGARLPVMAALIAAVTVLLLLFSFGSVALPVLSVALNMASIVAAFGVIVWIFADGHLSGLLGFTVTGSLQPSLVILILAVLFGLATDYQVFLLARIREAWRQTGDNASAVATGLQRTGRIITAAALLLVVVAVGFSSGQIVIAKTIGTGMIAALVIDASLVRILLTPALMRLLGPLNWWAPRPPAALAPLAAWRYGRHQ